MPVNTNVATRWEEEARAQYLVDPDTGLPTASVTSPLEVTEPALEYLGGGSFSLDGSTSKWLSPSDGATVVKIAANGGEVYYSINGTGASALSPGYVPDGQSETIGPICNMSALWVFSATADTMVHVSYWRRLNTALAGSWTAAAYWQRVMALNPIAYWPLWEASGTVAHCLVNPAQNGTYTGVTLGQTGIGDGNTCPLWDGSNDYLNVQTTALQGVFDGSEGSMVWWMRVSAATDWDGGTQRYVVTFVDTTDFNELIQLYKPSANAFRYRYQAAAVTDDVNKAGITTAAWIHGAITWSATADELKAYWNGAQEGATQGTLGAWAGTLDRAVIGAGSTVPAAVWSGYIAHFAIWDRVLSLSDIQELYGV